jgi:hypothetical protein
MSVYLTKDSRINAVCLNMYSLRWSEDGTAIRASKRIRGNMTQAELPESQLSSIYVKRSLQ